MKHLLSIFSLSLFAIFTSCSNNDEPEYHVFMQPASITAIDVNAWSQTFEYDEYGRIVYWTLTSNSDYGSAYSAHFDYTDANAIKVTSEEDYINGDKRYFQEIIRLINGRASESEGNFIIELNGNPQLRKTYRLAFEYDNANHLTVVKHSEVYGIGSDIKDNAWDNSWCWENYLIWEDGNLKEIQDYQGHTSLYQTRKYGYSLYAVEYPIIMPVIINSEHHTPLIMQGIFGAKSVNLVEGVTVLDNDGNLQLSRQYTYRFEDARIVEYSETSLYNTAFSNSISYSINWIEKFRNWIEN